jgi:hypothetical protein
MQNDTIRANEPTFARVYWSNMSVFIQSVAEFQVFFRDRTNVGVLDADLHVARQNDRPGRRAIGGDIRQPPLMH